jgi:hypothetical protein
MQGLVQHVQRVRADTGSVRCSPTCLRLEFRLAGLHEPPIGGTRFRKGLAHGGCACLIRKKFRVGPHPLVLTLCTSLIQLQRLWVGPQSRWAELPVCFHVGFSFNQQVAMPASM